MYNLSLLKKNNLFKDINDNDLEQIMTHFSQRVYNKNSTVFYQKDHIEFIYIIVTGKVEVNKHDLDGTKSIITILGKYDVFGESISLSSNNITPYNSMVLEDSKIAYISKKTFLTLAKNNQQLFNNMIEVLANKNAFMTFKLECLSKKNIQEKVFEVLRYYSIIQDSFDIVLPFNKSQLAEFLFVNRSALSREMTKMKDAGIFRYDSKHYYLNEEIFNN
ncbi:Crp/Fnr family transcriptional regulator [Mycoplasma sp. P36-A1]|uniref:Crp/Fnr family transcriptional regulator n=1 Tax=Mycoplasma sp. P36-A1 TaxID=3252900 RepID=UPI003C2E9537